jgi:hypothetical protein
MSNSPHLGVRVGFRIVAAVVTTIKLSNAIDLNKTMMPDEVIDKKLVKLLGWKRRRENNV